MMVCVFACASVFVWTGFTGMIKVQHMFFCSSNFSVTDSGLVRSRPLIQHLWQSLLHAHTHTHTRVHTHTHTHTHATLESNTKHTHPYLEFVLTTDVLVWWAIYIYIFLYVFLYIYIMWRINIVYLTEVGWRQQMVRTVLCALKEHDAHHHERNYDFIALPLTPTSPSSLSCWTVNSSHTLMSVRTWFIICMLPQHVACCFVRG